MLVVLVRTTILFILVIAALRFMGKRQIGELQPMELVVTILLSELAALPMQEPAKPILAGVLPILVIVMVEMILSAIALKSNAFRHLLEGKSVIVVENGKPDQQAMKKLRLTTHDLLEQLRIAGVFDLNEVKYAIIETNGQLSVLKKKEKEPPAAEDMNIQVPSVEMTYLVVSDGKIQKDSLKYLNLNENRINKILTDNNLKLKDIFMMQADMNGKFNIIKKETEEKFSQSVS